MENLDNNTSQFLHVKDNTLYLSTSLSEGVFSKTKLVRLLDTPSLFYNGNTFTQWKFDGTCVIDSVVHFKGTLPSPANQSQEHDLSAKQSGNTAHLAKIIAAYYAALLGNIDISCSSPNLVVPCGDGLIFVNEDMLTKCSELTGKEFYENEIEQWCSLSLSGRSKLEFTLASLIYYAITKKVPYPVGQQREARMALQCTVPLSLMTSELPQDLLSFVEDALSGRPATLFSKSCLDAIFSSEHIIFDKKDALSKKREAYIKKHQFMLQRRLFWNKWKGLCIAGIAVAASAIILGIWGYHENGTKPSTLGLKDGEVTVMFYSAIHNMRSDSLIACADNCLEAQAYISRVPQTYISGVMRGTLSLESGTCTPVEWFFFDTGSTKQIAHIIYGLTNFKMDGKTTSLDFVPPTKHHHPPPVRRNGKEVLGNFSTAKHTVEYSLVHTVDADLQVDTFTTEVTLRYHNLRWEIFSLSEKANSTTISTEAFIAALQKARDDNNDDIIQACNSLRQEYPWLPSDKALKDEKAKLARIGW